MRHAAFSSARSTSIPTTLLLTWGSVTPIELSFILGWTDQPVETLKRIQNLATTAIGLDASNPAAHALLGQVWLHFRQYDQAIDQLRLALDLNPSNAETYGWLGRALLFTGALEDAIKASETALRLDPNLDAPRVWDLGTAYFLAGRTADSIRLMTQTVAREPGIVSPYVTLAAAYSEAGKPEDAARTAAAVRKLDPFFDSASFGSLFRNPEHQAKIASALRKAGLSTPALMLGFESCPIGVGLGDGSGGVFGEKR